MGNGNRRQIAESIGAGELSVFTVRKKDRNLKKETKRVTESRVTLCWSAKNATEGNHKVQNLSQRFNFYIKKRKGESIKLSEITSFGAR